MLHLLHIKKIIKFSLKRIHFLLLLHLHFHLLLMVLNIPLVIFSFSQVILVILILNIFLNRYPVSGTPKGCENSGLCILWTVLHQVGVEVQRDLDVCVAGEVLHRLDIRAGEDQLGDVSVAQHVRSGVEVKCNDSIVVRNPLSDT